MGLQKARSFTDQADKNHKPQPPQGDEHTQAIEQALAELKRSAASRQAEHICAAYADVRKRLAGATLRELLDRVGAVLGPQANMTLVWAYSHRHCFMCDAGMIPCDQCEGEGVAGPGEKPCASCDGYGLTDCNFCQGTGWADAETIPPELRQAVRQSQFLIVQEELKRLKTEAGVLTTKFPRMDKAQRRRIGGWLMRLSARLAHLEQQAKAANDVSNQTAFGAAVGEVDALLQQLAHLVH